MNYYKHLSPKAKERTERYLQKIKEIEKTLAAAQRNLDNERSVEKSLTGHITRLKERSSDFLTDDKMSFERFKKDLRKLTVDLEISQESIRVLEGTIIPEKKCLLEGTQKDLILTLRILTTETVAIAEKVIADLLRQAEAERESFIDAVHQVHADYNLQFIFNDERLVPGAWPAAEKLELFPATGLGETESTEVNSEVEIKEPTPRPEPIVTRPEPIVEARLPAMSPGKIPH